MHTSHWLQYKFKGNVESILDFVSVAGFFSAWAVTYQLCRHQFAQLRLILLSQHCDARPKTAGECECLLYSEPSCSWEC